MKVFVLGSCRHLDDNRKQAFVLACDQLGAALAKEADSIILCSRSSHTADPYVLQGVRRKKSSTKILRYEPTDSESASPAKAQDSADIWDDIPVKPCEGGWRLLHLHAIRDADVIIAIGGSSRGTHTAIYSAELLSKPTVLIPSFGGAANENWDYFRGRYYRDDEAARLRQPWNDKGQTATGIVKATTEIVKRHARAGAAPLGQAILLTLAACAVAAWTYIAFAAPAFLHPAAALYILLTSASISGSILRLVLRNVGAFPTEWTEANAVTSIVLGVLIGFGLMLVGGFGNLALNGKMLTLGTYDDARRIGFSLSPVFFAVSLFLEQAWTRLMRRGLQRLEKSERRHTDRAR